jgi:serine/threonine protein kinase
MPLTPGTKLGPYEIQCPLGAGGMGEVYRARDTRLDRIVAIKILATHLSASPELKQRMEREARAISALNHPHICHLYDIGSQDGTDFLVMEFLEGETLADRLRKGALPLPEILKIGIAIADALAFAHRQGIVHRDLKPGNIMLTQSGAKLMDFGLAKPLGIPSTTVATGSVPAFTAAPTLTSPTPLSPLTTAGSIVGTIQYMSPEQIEGREADARSDIFAFGAVLYEMSAGKRPFTGKSQISLASAILENDPEPISATKPLTPAAFEHVVKTCLQKNPEERFQTAHDIKLQLQWIASGKSATTTPSLSDASQPATATKRERMVWVAALAAALVFGAVAAIFLDHPSQSAPTIRTVIDPPEKSTFNLTGDAAGPPVLSSDGTMLAFTAMGADGKTSIWVRPMNSLDAHVLADTDSATFPFWSPDSRSIGFLAHGKLETIDLNGGSPVVICDAPLGRGATWGPGGVVLFAPNVSSPIMRVDPTGGAPVAITKIDNAQHTSHRWPFILPDGKHFLYVAIHHDVAKSANNTLYFASIDGRESRALFRSQSNAIYAAGYLLFARGDQLMAQKFDPSSGKLSGDPQVVARGVMNDSSTWHMDASASDNGLLVLGSGGSGDLQLVWFDRATREISVLADKITNLLGARLSPQGDRVAMQIDTGSNDIWVLDVVRDVRTRLTFGPVVNLNPVWSPDGRWIAYESPRADAGVHYNIYRKQSDGSGAEELMLAGDDSQLEPDCWSSDGKYLLYTRRAADGHGEVWALPVEGDRKPSLVVPRGAHAHVSPDGHWLSYQSNESGITQVYVVAFGEGQGKWQVSANGGMQAQWSKDGKELFFIDTTYNLFAVPIKEVGGAIQFGAPEKLINNWSAPQVFFDVAPDSKRILLDRVAQQVSQSVTVVTNFTEALKK